MKHSNRYSPELRERAVRLVLDPQSGHETQWSAAECGPDFGALVPNPTTVAAIEAALSGEIVELGTPA